MTDLTVPSYEATGLDRFRWAIADTMTITWRNIIAMRRVPQVLVFSTIQPIIFVLMFRYVFGGSIQIPGLSYVDYLMPGIFTQTCAFGAISTAIGLAEDKGKGLVAVAVKAGFDMLTTKFLGLVASNGRAGDLLGAISAFVELSAKHRGVVTAEVVSAAALSPAQLKGVQAALAEALGKTPEVSTRVDPSLLGGLKVRVGSRLFDASLRSKLDSLKFALKRA